MSDFAGGDTIVMRRNHWWRGYDSTVICELVQGKHYAAKGYQIDWDSTHAAILAERKRQQEPTP